MGKILFRLLTIAILFDFGLPNAVHAQNIADKPKEKDIAAWIGATVKTELTKRLDKSVGLWAAGTKLIYPLLNNRFLSTMTIQTSGMGMRLDNVAAIISANAETDPENLETYEFAGLHKGIDVYNTLTVLKNVNISNQDFQTTQKSITLNGTVGSKVTYNTFSIPTATSPTNHTYDDCDIDWHLAENAIMPQQGDCFSGLASDALRTHWHYVNELGSTIGYDNYHIINESSSTLYLNIDNSPQSDPIENGTPLPYVIGNVDVEKCSLDELFQNMSCTVTTPIEGAGMVDCNNENNVEQSIYNFLRFNQRDSLLALLHCVDTEWAIRLLVGTYIDEHLFEQALAELQRLPNTPENAEFIALYQAIIEGGLEGSGKSSSATATVNTAVKTIIV